MKRFLALLLVLLTLSGCSGFANKDNIINLLSSPKLSQRESEIVECIKAHLGRDIILKYPKQGENVSPVQITDLSGDGTDQAVVMYTAPGQGGNVRMAVLTASDEGWHIDYDSEGYGTEIYKIIFANLDGKNGRQIIVGYTFADSSEKILAVYSADDGNIREVEYRSCQDFIVEDVTGDDVSDIVLAGINSDNKHTQLRILSNQGNSALAVVAAKQLSVPNSRVTNIIVSDTDFSDKNAILLDYTDSYFRVYTQAVYYEDYNLKTVLAPEVVQKRWVYDYSLNSKDVDGDGFAETPTVILSDFSQSENLKFMEWTGFLYNEPVRKYYGFCEADSGIYFPLPDNWQNLVSLRYGEDKNIWQVVKISDETVLAQFDLLSTGYSYQLEDDQSMASSGTLQVRITFDESVAADQREYITNGMMYIK